MKRILLESVDSTNNYAEKLAQESHENALIIAKTQMNGRGQFERTWFSEPDKSLTLSFLIWNEISLQEIPQIIVDTLKEVYELDARIVLPNDIYMGDKKLCGILIETKYEAQNYKYAVIGIGLNVNNKNFPDEIAEKATSIKLETGKDVDANEFINKLEEKMESLYA